MDPILKRIGDVTIERLTSRDSAGPSSSVPPNPTVPPPIHIPIMHDDSDIGSTDDDLPPEELNEIDDEDDDDDDLPIPISIQKSTITLTHKRKIDVDDDLINKKSKNDDDEDDFDDLSDLNDVKSSDVLKSSVKSSEKILRTNIITDEEDSEYDSEDDSDMDMEQEKLMDLKEGEKSDSYIEKLGELGELGESSQKSTDDKADASDYDYDITEKLKEMGEISVETVKKGEKPRKVETEAISEEISVTPAKKEGETSDENSETNSERKIGNMRRNIREVMDENQLDEATLAAQRQEMERLRRVQEQQRIIREVQRQIALNRQNNKTQHRVISLLQGGNSSIIKQITGTSTPGTSRLGSTVLVKLPNGETKPMTRVPKGQTPFEVVRMQKTVLQQAKVPRNFIPMKRGTGGNLTPSVSIAPVTKKIEPKIESDSDMEMSDSESKVRKIVGKPKGKDVVTISSSSDDDCIVLSEDEPEEPEPDEDPCNSGMHTNDSYNVPDEQGRVIINVGHPENEPNVFLAPQIARVIKPHQIGGVRFLYDNVIESIDRFDTSTGFGCILAHSMGLGKTLQVVCFCDIFLRQTSSKTILCIMPINTLQNWLAEFNMWLPKDVENNPLLNSGEVRPRNFNLHVLNDSHKNLAARAKVIQNWHKDGGVLLIGYELYRLLSLKRNPKSKSRSRKKQTEVKEEEEDDEKNKTMFDEIHEALVKPGPDLVICDEGHRIKNSHASISLALKQIRSKRRIVLTGYPLQNNLLEYWCMVDFVRPNYLGTKTEFSNMFERPIQNGQCIDSTPQDIRLMRYRAHVLHSLLEGFVQRRSHVVLQTSLPQKEEYVLLVRMTDFQRKLYDTFMNEVVRTKTVPNPLKAFAVCCKIWNHPDVLYYFLNKKNAGEVVDIDLEEVANAATATEGTKAAVSPKKGSRAKGGAKKERKTAKKDTAKPAASVTPNTNAPTSTITSQTDTSQSQTESESSVSTVQSFNQAFPNPNYQSNNTNNYQNNAYPNQNYQNNKPGFPNANNTFPNQNTNAFGSVPAANYQNIAQNQNISNPNVPDITQNTTGINYNQNPTNYNPNINQQPQSTPGIYPQNPVYNQPAAEQTINQNVQAINTNPNKNLPPNPLTQPFQNVPSNQNIPNPNTSHVSITNLPAPHVSSSTYTNPNSNYSNNQYPTPQNYNPPSQNPNYTPPNQNIANANVAGPNYASTVNANVNTVQNPNVPPQNYVPVTNTNVPGPNYGSGANTEQNFAQNMNSQQNMNIPGQNVQGYGSNLPGNNNMSVQNTSLTTSVGNIPGQGVSVPVTSGTMPGPGPNMTVTSGPVSTVPGTNPSVPVANMPVPNRPGTNTPITGNTNLPVPNQNTTNVPNTQNFPQNPPVQPGQTGNQQNYNQNSQNYNQYSGQNYQNYPSNEYYNSNQGYNSNNYYPNQEYNNYYNQEQKPDPNNPYPNQSFVPKQEYPNQNYQAKPEAYSNQGFVAKQEATYPNQNSQTKPEQNVYQNQNYQTKPELASYPKQEMIFPNTNAQPKPEVNTSMPYQNPNYQAKPETNPNYQTKPELNPFPNQGFPTKPDMIYTNPNSQTKPEMNSFPNQAFPPKQDVMYSNPNSQTKMETNASTSYPSTNYQTKPEPNPFPNQAFPPKQDVMYSNPNSQPKPETNASTSYPNTNYQTKPERNLYPNQAFPPKQETIYPKPETNTSATYPNQNYMKPDAYPNQGFPLKQETMYPNSNTQMKPEVNTSFTAAKPESNNPYSNQNYVPKLETTYPNFPTDNQQQHLWTQGQNQQQMPPQQNQPQQQPYYNNSNNNNNQIGGTNELGNNGNFSGNTPNFGNNSTAFGNNNNNNTNSGGNNPASFGTNFSNNPNYPNFNQNYQYPNSNAWEKPDEIKSSEVVEADKIEKNDKPDDELKEVDIKSATETAAALSKMNLKEDPGIPYDWAVELLKGYVPGVIENSAKMQVFFCILQESMALGDRILLFSQSLFTLNLIEDFLQVREVPGSEVKWAKNRNYYRLDGSTSALEREKLINEFNSNPNIHLFLVSTRAGSLGINLVGANRVIVFDASWNPCHDTQAVCRVYRYGQKKPCFVYRLVMDHCLEKKIYDRQINKQGMSDRVVDECNPDAHLSMKEVTNLCWDDEPKETEVKDFSISKDKYIDVVMQKVLDAFSDRLSKEPFQHESLLIDRKEKKLSQAEKRLAKRSYELEKQANINSRPTYSSYYQGGGQGLQIRAIRTQDGLMQNKPIASVRPMQSEMRPMQSDMQPLRTGTRTNRWIPAEVWQRQGMTAQEMTLPLDVVIPTNSPDRGSIVLKAGQKVLVLKSPKGIYMQLECGKIVAIKTAFKVRGGKAPEGGKPPEETVTKEIIPPSTLLKKVSGVSIKPATVPLPLKNNSAITVIPKTGPQKLVKPLPQNMKLNMRSIRQPVPNLITRQVPIRMGGPRMTGKIQSIHRKIPLAKSKPYNLDKTEELLKSNESSPTETHVVPSSDEELHQESLPESHSEGKNETSAEMSEESSDNRLIDRSEDKSPEEPDYNPEAFESSSYGSEIYEGTKRADALAHDSYSMEKYPEKFMSPESFPLDTYHKQRYQSSSSDGYDSEKYPSTSQDGKVLEQISPDLSELVPKTIEEKPKPALTKKYTPPKNPLKNYRHTPQKAGPKSSKLTSTALHHLEQTTSAIGDAKQPFQETLDNITNSYTEKPEVINLDEKDDIEIVEAATTVKPKTADDSKSDTSEYNYYGYSYNQPGYYPEYPEKGKEKAAPSATATSSKSDSGSTTETQPPYPGTYPYGQPPPPQSYDMMYPQQGQYPANYPGNPYPNYQPYQPHYDQQPYSAPNMYSAFHRPDAMHPPSAYPPPDPYAHPQPYPIRQPYPPQYPYPPNPPPGQYPPTGYQNYDYTASGYPPPPPHFMGPYPGLPNNNPVP